MNILNNPDIKRVHLLGIGGIGVSGLAEILLAKSYKVSGSDISVSSITKRLQQLGAVVHTSHSPEHVKNVDAVVYSSAIRADNPELVAAQQAGIPVVRRGQLLAELMQEYPHSIAVAGTHGKTTTTALLAYSLLSASYDTTFVMGGMLRSQQSPVSLTKSDYFIAEADESDASFLYLQPQHIIVTNIDADHLETYENDIAQLQQAFIDFLNRLPDTGYAILCIDDPGVNQILSRLTCRYVTYGFSERADVVITEFRQQGLKTMFNVNLPNENGCSVKLNLPGIHNVSNAAAVVTALYFLNVKYLRAVSGFNEFPGVGRRFCYQGELTVADGSASVYDDYGHHPREVQATIAAARLAWPQRRIVMVFQPHRFTRTRDLMQDFVNVLSRIDCLILLDIYSAGEVPIEGVDGEALSREIAKQAKHTPIFVADSNQLSAILAQTLRANDLVLFQGAGNIGPLARKIVQAEQLL